MSKGKEVKVALVGEAKRVYLSLQEIIKKEVKLGKKGTDHQILFKSIQRAIKKLKENPQCGVHIQKRFIPHYYVRYYGVENLWKYDLANFWHMVYWIDGSDEVCIVSFVVDIFDHKVYNKRFGHSKR